MKADAMVWVQRIVGAVFAVGVAALVGAIVTQVGQAEGLPPLPIFVGMLGIVMLVLLSGACLALVSLAISARRGADALRRIAGQGVAAPAAAPVRVFSQTPLREVVAEPQPEPVPVRPARPAGRTLVAER
ncbi:hypothetical protein GIY56_06395 [Paracoccus sp. YIM 132242]|uniref:Uncharacterized protein n=1 Tax=Paracoccus lichenicola TaxID=2665644 RepID=A0A6L6HNQ4_9RHOB|nr:hypothetical protein [Paracoccus lichenicola]MTD99909.1 hypothetical protein [Paracoccus lichenicola]